MIDLEFSHMRSSESERKWDPKFSKEGVRVFIHKEGSKFSSSFPFVKVQFSMNKYLEMNKIIEAMYVDSHRKVWDKGMVLAESVP